MASACETPGSTGAAMAVFAAARNIAVANRMRVPFEIGMI
jgi:hypothetical protein